MGLNKKDNTNTNMCKMLIGVAAIRMMMTSLLRHATAFTLTYVRWCVCAQM